VGRIPPQPGTFRKSALAWQKISLKNHLWRPCLLLAGESE